MKWWFKKHTEEGLEKPDPTPMESTLNMQRPLTIHEQIARFVRDPQFIENLKSNGVDTFDEADNFGPDDEEEDFASPYEARKMHPDDPEFVQTRADELRQGVVQDIPIERQKRIQERLNTKPKQSETIGDKLDKLIEKISPANAGEKK